MGRQRTDLSGYFLRCSTAWGRHACLAGNDRSAVCVSVGRSPERDTDVLRIGAGAEMKLILIRHGKTEANEKHLYCGATNIPLSDGGRMELYEKKQSIVYPAHTGYRILTSSMIRCEETLSILYGEIPHETDASFREMDFGAFEMRSYGEMQNDPDYIRWISGDNEANITPGGESGKQMTERVICGLQNLIAAGQDTILFTHGGVIAAIMAHLFPNEDKNRYEWQPKPGSGYTIDLIMMQYTFL